MNSDVGSTSSLDRAAILALVRDQLAIILEVTPDDIDEDIPFEVMGADSLALIELVEALEELLATHVAGFHIDDEDLEGLSSVRDAVDYVAAKLQLA
jgi:acyl carrier protein